ncbi:MAG: hypothetical protein IT326_00050 [Anaerolineae bacterium]|nr:hypothetical protein [Anaerolineae bacterium]
MPAYDFDEQHEIGKRAEAFLDSIFMARGHLIQPATRGQQRLGIDRVFLRDGKVALVEYKTDNLAHRTGHVFVETISVDSEGRAGWAYTSTADFIVYYVPGNSIAYVIPVAVLREAVSDWAKRYPERSARNDSYATHGILVPLEEFAKRASQVLKINGRLAP